MSMNAKVRIAIALARAGHQPRRRRPARLPAPPPLKPYKVGFNAWIGSIAFFVARDKGFFKDEGLDLQAKSFSAPGDGLTPLVDRRPRRRTSARPTACSPCSTRRRDSSRSSTSTDTSAGADAVLAKKDIADVKAMKGKKVAATLGQCNHLLLQKALEKAGLTEKDIQLVNMNPDDAGAAFAAGKIDVAVTWEPWITKASGDKKGHVIFSSQGDAQPDPGRARRSARRPPRTSRRDARVPQGPEPRLRIRAEEPRRGGGDRRQGARAEAGRGQGDASQGAALQPGEERRGDGRAGRGRDAQVAKFFKDKKVNETLVDVSKLYDASFLK